jgi:hypothetical protein
MLLVRGFCFCVQHNRERRDVVGLHVAVHQEALAVFGYVIAEHVRRGDRCASVTLIAGEKNHGQAGVGRAHVLDHARADVKNQRWPFKTSVSQPPAMEFSAE